MFVEENHEAASTGEGWGQEKVWLLGAAPAQQELMWTFSTGYLHQLSVLPIAWLARDRKERHHGFEEWCVSRLAWVSPPDEILQLLRQLDTMLWEQARRSWGNDQAAQHTGHPARRRKFPSQFEVFSLWLFRQLLKLPRAIGSSLSVIPITTTGFLRDRESVERSQRKSPGRRNQPQERRFDTSIFLCLKRQNICHWCVFPFPSATSIYFTLKHTKYLVQIT